MAFEPFTKGPVPTDSQLHLRLSNTMERLHRAAPSHVYATQDGQQLLPDTAGNFFIHCTRLDPSLTSTLQTKLNAKATSYLTGAAIETLRVRSRQGDKRPWAHWKAITAPAAWMWKATQPLGPRMKMSDVQYRLAVRLNLDADGLIHSPLLSSISAINRPRRTMAAILSRACDSQSLYVTIDRYHTRAVGVLHTGQQYFTLNPSCDLCCVTRVVKQRPHIDGWHRHVRVTSACCVPHLLHCCPVPLPVAVVRC